MGVPPGRFARIVSTMHVLALWAMGLTITQFPSLTPLKASRDLHEYDLLDVKWDVDFSNGKSEIKGTVINKVKTTKDGALLVFDCAALKVQELLLNGSKTKSIQSGDYLAVQCPPSIKSGTTVDVEIHYTGSPTAGIYFVPAERTFPAKTAVVFTQGEMIDNRYWLPTFDDPSDKATSEGTIHAPKGWKVLSNGKLIGTKEEKTQSIWHWKMDKPHSTYLISLVAGKYSIVPDGKWEGIEVSNWVPQGLESWIKSSFGGTDKIVAFYSKLTGVKYAWPKYAQSAVPEFMFGGMENVSCTTQTMGAVHHPSTHPIYDETGLVAHELAHQWFGDLITTPSWDSIWINEGWATFLPHFWTRQKSGEDSFNVERIGTYEAALQSSINTPRPMVWSGWSEPIDMFDGMAYPGGATRMMMLMHLVGEDRFWPAVTKYLEEYKFKNVDTKGFFKSFSKNLDMDLSQFEKQWFYTAGAPNLEVSKTAEGYQVVQKTPGFTVPIEYVVVGTDGSTQPGKAEISENTPLTVKAGPDQILILDPDAWLMASITYPKTYGNAEALLAFITAKSSAQKMRLISSGMIDLLYQKQLTPLIGSERNWQVVNALIGKSTDVDLLLELTKNSDVRIVNVAAERLGTTSGDARVPKVLRDIFSTSKSDPLRLTAFKSLFSVTKDPKLIDEAWKTTSYDDLFRVTSLDWLEQTDRDKAREKCLAVLKSNEFTPIRNEAIRILGRIKDRPNEHVALDALMALTTPTFSELSAWITAVADYGTKQALPKLRKLQSHSLHFVRNQAKGAVSQLGG